MYEDVAQQLLPASNMRGLCGSRAGVDIIVMTLPRWGLGGGDAEPEGSDDAMTMTITLFSLYILAKCVKK